MPRHVWELHAPTDRLLAWLVLIYDDSCDQVGIVMLFSWVTSSLTNSSLPLRDWNRKDLLWDDTGVAGSMPKGELACITFSCPWCTVNGMQCFMLGAVLVRLLCFISEACWSLFVGYTGDDVNDRGFPQTAGMRLNKSLRKELKISW